MIDLLEKVCQGNVRAIARTITAVENDEAMAQNVTAAIYARTGNAHLIGVTGPPGSGKSTLVNELAIKFNDLGKTVGIIAVDPSSPFTGGAILGDRVRMNDIVNRDGVFVRSMATRGTLGGLAQATSTAIRILDAAGYEIILIETVGAGQAEIDIASVAHTVIVVEAPGSGDEVQSIKAGILEIADILVVNKADRPSALRTVRSLEMMLQLGQPMSIQHHAPLATGNSPLLEKDATISDPWQVPVMQTIAISGQGIDDLIGKIINHRNYLNETGEILQREIQRSRREIERLLQDQIVFRIHRLVMAERRDQLVTAVAKREMDPYSAAEQLFELAKDHLS